MEDYKFLFKVVLIGNAGVGKTCLVRRFTQGLFPPGQGATIGVDFLIKTVQVDGEKVKLQIWDTAGQERFRSITQSYYRSAHALVLVYDISSQPSFDCLPMWLREMEQYANPKVFRALVGNKTDKEDREIPCHVGQEFAKSHNMDFIETSAKGSENVEKLFLDIAVRLTHEAKARVRINNSELSRSIGEQRERNEHQCCKFS
ncbi:ras-related protein Rab-30-like [Tachypleus tridentatus]|uniref:ras-related protein Rab-30-like n=1 Tax=Tachypleus tridentatus TaxID=6853 RepID=UPI003FD53688